jgi:3-oxoacyl-[acyl-carrier protein] reductase
MGFTRSAALEFADHNIRVNAIAPGAIKTPGTAGTSDEVLKQMEQTIPIKRLGTPEDIADAVLFLASDASSYITGQCITVDGGKTLVF